MALHTLSSALATGSIEGAVAGGGTAIVVPKVDEYLKNQGYDEDTRKAVLVGLSAGIGGTVGNNTAGVANSVNQTENNYLSHKQMEQWALQLEACGNDGYCKQGINAYYQNLSKQQDADYQNACFTKYNTASYKFQISQIHSITATGDHFALYERIRKAGGGNVAQGAIGSSNGEAFNRSTLAVSNVNRAEGRHGGGYYKISTTNKGIIKVVDKATYKPTEKEKAKIIYK